MSYKTVITKTPMRISFFGGGTDFEKYFKKYSGSVISTSINKYIYVTVKTQNFFYENYRLNYSKTERVSNINQIQNNIIRECIKYCKIKEKLYVSTISDIPGMTGLGSSSAFTVGLLKALYQIKGINKSNNQIAKIAAEIEIKKLGSPIGIQDHYSCAVGGFKKINFSKNGKVKIIKLDKIININDFLKKSCLIWTNSFKNSNIILKSQKKNIRINSRNLNLISQITKEVYSKIIFKKFKLKEFQSQLVNSWMIKKQLTKKISNQKIENIIKIFSNKEYGFKILGAGGGGFLFLLGDINKKILNKNNLKKIDILSDTKGSEIIYKNNSKY